MTLNLRPRNFQITIYNASGASPIDVSDAVMDWTVSDRQLDESGLIQTTGQLTLHSAVSIGESYDARINPARWARGNRVVVLIANALGTLVPHFRSALRILKEPLPPHPKSPEITIELGCILELLDYRQPPDDQSGISLGVSTLRSVIINRLLTAAGAPALIDAIAEFPINYPLFRMSGGYIQQAGAIAYAAGYVLWVDSQERVRATKINLSPSSPLLTLTVGQEDSDYEPLQDAETPCELIRVTGVGYSFAVGATPDPQFSRTYDDVGLATTTSVFYTNMLGRDPVITTTRTERLNLLMPDAHPTAKHQVKAEDTIESSTYELGQAGRLTLKRRDSLKPKGVVLGDRFPGSTEMITASREFTTYVYKNEVLVSEVRKLREPRGVVRPETSENPLTLIMSRTEITTYQKLSSGWLRIEDVSTRKTGDTSGSSVSYSDTSNQPPAPERLQPLRTQVEKLMVGEIKLRPRAGSSFRDREREYQLPDGVAVSIPQLEEVARRIGAVLAGRHQGMSWVSSFRDEWLTGYQPLCRIDWIDGNNKFSYLADGISFSLSQRECAIGADGIWIGISAVVGGGGIEPPYQVFKSLRIGTECGAELRPDLNVPVFAEPILFGTLSIASLGQRSKAFGTISITRINWGANVDIRTESGAIIGTIVNDPN